MTPQHASDFALLKELQRRVSAGVCVFVTPAEYWSFCRLGGVGIESHFTKNSTDGAYILQPSKVREIAEIGIVRIEKIYADALKARIGV